MSLIRIERLASKLNVSVPTVRLWISKGKIPYYSADRLQLFDLDEVLTALRHNGSTAVLPVRLAQPVLDVGSMT